MHNSKTYINKTESVAILWLRTSSVVICIMPHLARNG